VGSLSYCCKIVHSTCPNRNAMGFSPAHLRIHTSQITPGAELLRQNPISCGRLL
jgi:hypothetical protein